MKKILRSLYWCMLLTFSLSLVVYGQNTATEDIESTDDDSDMPPEYFEWLKEREEKRRNPPTKERFLEKDNTRQYLSLKKKLKQPKVKATPSKGNPYLELMSLLEEDFGMEGLLQWENNLRWRTPYAEVNAWGLSWYAMLPSGGVLSLNTLDEAFVEHCEGYHEVGGAFHLSNELDWDNATLGIKNNFIYARQKIAAIPDRGEDLAQGERVAVFIPLADNVLLTLVEDVEIKNEEELVAWATSSISSKLMGLLLSDFKKGIDRKSFLAKLVSDWKVDLSTAENFGKGGDQDLIVEAKQAGLEEPSTFAYSCDDNSIELYLPYQLSENYLSDERSTPPEIINMEGLDLQIYEDFGREGMVKRLYSTDGKSFVDLPLNGKENLDQLAKKIHRFFEGWVDCQEVSRDRAYQQAAIQEMMKFVVKYQEDAENKHVEGYVEAFINHPLYQEYLELLKKRPVASTAIKWSSNEIKDQFKDLLSPIADQLGEEVFEIKGLNNLILPFEGMAKVPGSRIFITGKLPEKDSEYMIGMYLINEKYSKYISYYAKESASLLFPLEGSAFGAISEGRFSVNLSEQVPNYFFTERRAPVHVMATPIADHAVFYITAPTFEYSQSEMQELLSSLAPTELAAFAYEHRTINASYWEQMKVFPTTIEGKELAVLFPGTEFNSHELRLRNFDGEIVLAAYDTPLRKSSAGHFYFLVGCDSDQGFDQVFSTLQASEGIQKGKFFIKEGANPRAMYGNQGGLRMVTHSDAPTKLLIYTLDRDFEEKELQGYFDDFFTGSMDCEILNTGK